MKFMMFVCPDKAELARGNTAAIPAAVEEWATEMERRGVRLQGHVLASDASGVRVRDGSVSVDPSDASAPIAGFNILECADLDEALEVSAKHPMAAFGTLELRAIAA